MLSLHQSALVRALAGLGHEVQVVAAQEVSQDRRAAGWGRPDLGLARILIAPEKEVIENTVKDGLPDTIHIIGGARWTPLGRLATHRCIEQRACMGIMSEAAEHRGWKGRLRRFRYTIERQFVGRRFDFVLAMGQVGVNWFRNCGYPAERTFCFAYFTEKPEGCDPCPGREARQDVELLYVGQLIPRKRVDSLIRALAACGDLQWRLTIVGGGPDKPVLQKLIRAARLDERVRFLDFLENKAAVQVVAASDLLVLPSRWDGWGAVVNEALMCGVPVICSDHCGAADLLHESWRGEVFAAGSVSDLTNCLRRWISCGRTPPETRARIQAWSQCITGEAGARYLEGILRQVYEQGPRPAVPWRNEA